MEHQLRPDDDLPLIKIVGVSASGKSTLVRHLRKLGYNARPVSQEHSNLSDLWEQFEPPDLLIYLNNDLANQRIRRPDVSWTALMLITEQQRLAHARDHADLRVFTPNLSAKQVLGIVCFFLEHHQIQHANHALPPLSETGMLRKPEGLSPNGLYTNGS